jgi:hypothetical protein
MAISRYEREQQQIASRRFTRGVAKIYLIGAGIGLLIGLIWVIAGLLNFHVLR